VECYGGILCSSRCIHRPAAARLSGSSSHSSINPPAALEEHTHTHTQEAERSGWVVLS